MNQRRQNFTAWYLVGITLLDFIGLGIVVTLFPKLLLDPNSGVLPSGWTQGARMAALGVFLAVYPFGQFMGAAILGKLSDHHGRKKLMLVTLVGTLFGFIVSGISIAIGSGILLFLSRLLAGLFAGNIAITQASMADISTPETKSRNFSRLQIALGGSWVIGPPMGGWLSSSSLVSWFNATTPFWVVSALLALAVVFTVFFYRETLLEPKTEKIKPLAGLQEIHHAFTNKHLRPAFIVWLVFISGWWLFEAFLPAYLQQRFYFNPDQIGNFLASMGATYALFQIFVVQHFSQMKPEVAVRRFLIISGISVTAIAFVHDVWMLHIMITLFVTSMGFCIPNLITSISNLANKSEQGHVMGMVGSIQAFATVCMMVLGGFLEAISLNITVIGGGLLLLVSWIMFVILFKVKKA